MNTHLNKQQIDHYRRDGFAVHENLLTKSELEELRAAVDEAVAAMGKKKVAGGEHGEARTATVITTVFSAIRN